MVRIALLADTHLGYRKGDRVGGSGRNARTEDFAIAFLSAIDQIEDHHRFTKPFDMFVHAGDVFDRPRPDYLDISLVGTAIQRFRELGLPQIWIAGNHDLSRIPTASSPFSLLSDLFRFDPNVIIAGNRTPWLIQFPGLPPVDVIPWGSWESTLWPIDFFPEERLAHILVAHGDVGADGVLRDRNLEVDLRADEYGLGLLGHLHYPQFRGDRLIYPGPTERCGWRDYAAITSWSEVEWEPGSLPVVRRSADTESRTMIDLGECYASDLLDRLESASRDPRWSRAMVRILVKGVTRQKMPEVRQVAAEALAPWSLQIDHTEPGRTYVSPQVHFTNPGSLDLVALFEEFVSGLEDPDYAERLRIRGRAAIEQAIEAERSAEFSEVE